MYTQKSHRHREDRTKWIYVCIFITLLLASRVCLYVCNFNLLHAYVPWHPKLDQPNLLGGSLSTFSDAVKWGKIR